MKLLEVPEVTPMNPTGFRHPYFMAFWIRKEWYE